MPDRRISFYPSETVQRLLDAISDCTATGRINQVADVYMLLMDGEIASVRWTEPQWCAVLDALNGAQIGMLTRDSKEWQFAWANVADSPYLDEKWNVSHQALAAEMRAMSVLRKLAVYEAAARFRSRSELPTAAALAASGIRPYSAEDV